jgi:hypothetical protein
VNESYFRAAFLVAEVGVFVVWLRSGRRLRWQHRPYFMSERQARWLLIGAQALGSAAILAELL